MSQVRGAWRVKPRDGFRDPGPREAWVIRRYGSQKAASSRSLKRPLPSHWRSWIGTRCGGREHASTGVDDQFPKVVLDRYLERGELDGDCRRGLEKAPVFDMMTSVAHILPMRSSMHMIYMVSARTAGGAKCEQSS